jgi:hypothetical protein
LKTQCNLSNNNASLFKYTLPSFDITPIQITPPSHGAIAPSCGAIAPSHGAIAPRHGAIAPIQMSTMPIQMITDTAQTISPHVLNT